MSAQRFSKKREAIYRVVCSTTSHPSAKWVYDQIRQEYPDISLATVYRNLALFKESGQLVSVAVVDGEERFDTMVSPHGHFVCTLCGEVLDLDVLRLDAFEREVERQIGAEVESHSVIFYGRCADCRCMEASD